MASRPLTADLTVTGHDQANLNRWMANMTDLIVELQADHATTKTAVDEIDTVITEMMTDHDADNTHIANLKTLVNNIRTHLTGDRLFSGDPALVLDTNFDVKTGANEVTVSVEGSLGTVASGANCDTGAAATFPTTKWGIFNVTAVVAGTLTATWDTNSSSGYDNEAAAIAALPAAPASEASIGYVTVKAHASGTFLAGTDALKAGTGGDPAAETNYYTLADPLGVVTAAVGTSAAANLTAPNPTAGPATLTNSTAPTLLKA